MTGNKDSSTTECFSQNKLFFFFFFKGEIKLLRASCQDAIVVKPATLDGAEHASHKKVAKVTFLQPIQTERQTDGQQERITQADYNCPDISENHVNSFLFRLLTSSRKKENYLCLLGEKRRTILVFALKVKANSTQCFGRQHHKTANVGNIVI